MVLDCISDKVSPSVLNDHPIFNDYSTYGCRANVKLTHFVTNNQNPLKLLRIFELKVNFKS